MAQSYEILGREVRLPVVVRLARSAASMFVVPTDPVRRLLDQANLQVPEVVPGRTLMSIATIDYVDNDLGDYDEISIAFFVREGARRPARFLSLPLGLVRGTAHAYIHRLPVNQRFTCEAGRTIWGFPKTVDTIEIDDAGDRRVCTWHAEEQLVLRIECPIGGKRTDAERTMISYACRDGVLYRTPFTSHGEESGVHFGGVRLELGDHPIADELRALGLPRRAAMTQWVGRMSAEFGAPEKL